MKKNMKQILSAILSAVLILTLTACVANATNTPKEKTNINAENKAEEKINTEDKINTENTKDFEKLVANAYYVYDVLYGFASKNLIDETTHISNVEYLPTIKEEFKEYAAWENFIKEIFEEKIAEEILNNKTVINKDGKTYIKTGHVPQYIEWELAEDYKKNITMVNDTIQVKMIKNNDAYNNTEEVVLNIKYQETDYGPIISNGTFVDKLFNMEK